MKGYGKILFFLVVVSNAGLALAQKRESAREPATVEYKEVDEAARRGNWALIRRTLAPEKDVLPDHPAALYSESLFRLGDGARALSSAEAAHARLPEAVEVKVGLAKLLMEGPGKPDLDRAIKLAFAARTLDSSYQPAWELQLKAVIKQGGRTEARQLIEDMMVRFKATPDLLVSLCDLYAKDALVDRAIETCNEAIQKDPVRCEAYVSLASFWSEQKEEDRFNKTVESALSKCSDKALVYALLAEVRFSKSAYKEAFEAADRAITGWRGKAQGKILVLRADSALELARYDEALKSYKEACAVDRQNLRSFEVASGKLRARGEKNWHERFDRELVVACKVMSL